MKTILLTSLAILCFTVSAQNNLVVFTQESKPFYVIVNGIRQNMNAETNIKVENLPGEFYKVKVVFADGKTPDVDKSISFMEKNQEYSLELKEKKGKFKMRYAGMRPINQSTSTATSINYHETEIEESTQSGTGGNVQTNTNVNNTGTETSTSSSVNESGQVNTSVNTSTNQNGSMGVNVEMSENGVSMQVNVPNDQMENNTESTVSSSSQVNTNLTYAFVQTGTMCASPTVSQKDFIEFKYILDNANMFKRQELILAYFKSNCMLSEQVAGLIKINYSTVDAKKIAKEGYRYTYDTDNYGVVINALNSSSEQQEVLTFIGAGSGSSSSSSQSSVNSTNANVQINSSTTTTINNSSTEHQQSSSSNNESSTQYSQIPSYSGYVNCNTSIISDIQDIKRQAESEAFADEQRKVIETASKNRCFTVDQVSTLAKLFSHESDQLSFMKWAFDKTYDIDNFYKLSSQLTFSSSKEELDAFIDKQPTAHFTYVYSTTANDGMLIDDKDLKNRMENESFADDQLALAKQALVSRYISTSQVKNIATIFNHESDKLQFLRMAYPRTSDKENFHQLRATLTFDSSKTEFDKILEGQ